MIFKPKVDWKAQTRNDIVRYNHAEDFEKCTKGLKIDDMVSADYRERPISIIKSTGTVSTKKARVVQSSGTN